jgi:hypothetical protein
MTTFARINDNDTVTWMLECIRADKPADFLPRHLGLLDPLDGPQWGNDCAIPAETIFQLCAGKFPDIDLGPRGIAIIGARIEGDLNLDGVKFKNTLRMQRCYFPGKVSLSASEFSLLDLGGSYVAGGMDAQFLTVTGDVLLGGFRTTGGVSLSKSEISGDLDCSGANLQNYLGAALDLNGVTIDAAVLNAAKSRLHRATVLEVR